MTPRDYAVLAQQAYTTAPSIGNPDSAARAVIFSGGAVGFPGTNNLACWLADLDAEAIDVPDMGRLHTGFWRAFQEIAGPLLALEGVPVTLGHSEGAALALLYAAQLCLAGKPPAAVYAFEPPRVSADGTLAALFKLHGVALYLYRNGEDVVPLVPRITEDWQHPGELMAIGKASVPIPNVEDHFIDRVIAAFPV
ncbi:lipase family protein [Paludibacterium purpuratum]|uniref:lipase family protein n=1 Tax=Paludibacterium purpuratum TaxID=1144873 RepID=UPI00105DA7A5|nr:lipase [Paludibacterium purpuratum]